MKSNVSRTAGQIHFTDMLPSKSAAAPVCQQAAIKKTKTTMALADQVTSTNHCSAVPAEQESDSNAPGGILGTLSVQSCLFHFLQAGECLLHSA